MDTYDVLVIGGGNGGLSLAGRLRRARVGRIAVVEPRSTHVFAPLQSHIAGGVVRASRAVRTQESVTPRGVTWLRDEVVGIRADDRVVELNEGDPVGYRHLVLAPGIEMRWDAVAGLAEAMASPSGISNYRLDLAEKASRVLRDTASGTAVFVQAPQPASCAGAAQKPMYRACDYWRRTGVLDDIRVVFATPDHGVASVAEIDAELRRKLDEYGIETVVDAPLAEIDAERREATLSVEGRRESIAYDVLHVEPPQSPPAWIAASGLGDDDGFVDVDPETLRHRRRPEVWALGDAAAVHTERSGGSIRSQAKVLARNLVSAERGRALRARYDGYTVCPYTVSRRTVVFAEHDRRGRLAPTVPGWRRMYRESRLTWIADRYVLPWVYWNLILRGRA